MTGPELRAARLAKGIQQAELARAVHLSPSRVAKVERGIKASLAVLRRLTAALERMPPAAGDPARRRHCRLCLGVGHYADDCGLTS